MILVDLDLRAAVALINEHGRLGQIVAVVWPTTNAVEASRELYTALAMASGFTDTPWLLVCFPGIMGIAHDICDALTRAQCVDVLIRRADAPWKGSVGMHELMKKGEQG